MDVRYTYRLRPGATAQRYLHREWGMCRWVWNQLVAESRRRSRARREFLEAGADPEGLSVFGYAEQDRHLTFWRRTAVDAETGERWLQSGSSVAQQQTVRDFDKSRRKALADRKNGVSAPARAGMPGFKSRHRSRPTMNYTARGFALKPHPETGRLALVLPGKVVIPIVWSRDLPTPPKSARVSQDACGHWYVSFVVQIAPSDQEPTGTRVIGVDWGVTETATTVAVDPVTGDVDEATTFDLPHAQHGKSAAAKLARYQQMMARRRPPRGGTASKGYKRAKKHAAAVQAKVARQRQDDARKWAHKIVRAAPAIAVEDFHPKFLAKSTMAKKAADGAIGVAKAELLWQATKHGREIRLVDPRNTTTDCSTCGARTKHRLPLGQRVYTCLACNTTRARDKNSAAVMVARAGFVPADAEGIRPDPATRREQAA